MWPRGNAKKIAELTGHEESDLEEARAFYESLGQIDPEVAKRYFDNIPWELQQRLRHYRTHDFLGMLSSESDGCIPTPAATLCWR